MIGGRQGFCDSRGFRANRWCPDKRFSGGGRGWRCRYWTAGMLGRMRGGSGAPWAFDDALPYGLGDERTGLREYAAWLKDELGAVEERLRQLEVRSVKEEK
jgi:hypothetical protein